MNQPPSPHIGGRQQAGRLRRFARSVREAVAEWSYAQHRVIELATAPDRYLLNPDAAPDTFDEFLFRTSGVLHHEPPARARTRC